MLQGLRPHCASCQMLSEGVAWVPCGVAGHGLGLLLEPSLSVGLLTSLLSEGVPGSLCGAARVRCRRRHPLFSASQLLHVSPSCRNSLPNVTHRPQLLRTTPYLGWNVRRSAKVRIEPELESFANRWPIPGSHGAPPPTIHRARLV